MSTKGVGGPKLDWAPWAELASQVQQVKSDVIARQPASEQGAVDAKHQTTEESTLAKVMKQVLAKHPNLVEASPAALEDAAATAAKMDAVYAPLLALSQGLQSLSRFTEPQHSRGRYPWIFQQMENVEKIRDAVEAAGSALAKFPNDQLDELQKALRVELAELGETHGDAVRTNIHTALPIDRTLDADAVKMFESLQEMLATLNTNAPHEIFAEPAARNFDARGAMATLRQVAQRYPGGTFGLTTVLGKLSSHARETGKRIETDGLVKELLRHAPESGAWGDVVHAFLRATNADAEIERRPRQKTRAGLLTQSGQQAWTMVSQSGPIWARINEAGELDLLAKTSAKNDHRPLDANRALELAAKFIDDDPRMISMLNNIAQRCGATAFVGLPAGLEDKRKALGDAVEQATELVTKFTTELGELATAIGSRRTDVQAALRTALQRIRESPSEEVADLVKTAQGVFEAAEKDALDYRAQLVSMLADITGKVDEVQADLRTKETAFRAAVAPVRGELDVAPTPDGMAQTLDLIERSMMSSVGQIRSQLVNLETGSTSANVRSHVGTIEADVGNALVQVLRAGAQKTKSTEVKREQEAAALAAQEKRDATTAEPLTMERLLELPLEDLAAYRLHGNVMSWVSQVRNMRLEPEIGRAVLGELVKLDADPIQVRPQGGLMANSMVHLFNAVQRVGSGTSPKTAIDWIARQLPTMLKTQQSDEAREIVARYASRLTDSLERM